MAEVFKRSPANRDSVQEFREEIKVLREGIRELENKEERRDS
jgi:polyhydroxyalkanoate synthesis regulator phasin